MADDWLDNVMRNNEPPEEEGPSYPFSIAGYGNDHHFGMEAKSSGTSVPYTNRGRGELLWKTLIAYGFERITDSKGKHYFKDKIPHPCFEYSMRIHFKNNGKEYKWPGGVDHATGIFGAIFEISTLAGSIRSSLKDGYADGYRYVENIDDALLVRNACSTEGLVVEWYVPLIGGIVKSAICVAIGKNGIAPGAILVNMALLFLAMFVLRSCTEAEWKLDNNPMYTIYLL